MIHDHPGIPITHIVRVCECGLSVEVHRDSLPPGCSGWRAAGWGEAGPGRPLLLKRRSAA